MGEVRCYWMTGLPASGKTTLSKAWVDAIQRACKPASLLDGDELRKGLCADLGLSEADRTENIRRAGEVARLMVNAGLTVVCAFVSPFAADRRRVRSLFPVGHFAEVHLSTPLEECVRRDPKKLYAQAMAGKITGLTGWDAPYDKPVSPEFTFDTSTSSLDTMLDTLERGTSLARQ